jgi:CTP synthase
MIELGEGHPYFVGCQFHPEFKSRPMAPHPLFRQFIQAALDFSDRRSRKDAEAEPKADLPRIRSVPAQA